MGRRNNKKEQKVFLRLKIPKLEDLPPLDEGPTSATVSNNAPFATSGTDPSTNDINSKTPKKNTKKSSVKASKETAKLVRKRACINKNTGTCVSSVRESDLDHTREDTAKSADKKEGANLVIEELEQRGDCITPALPAAPKSRKRKASNDDVGEEKQVAPKPPKRGRGSTKELAPEKSESQQGTAPPQKKTQSRGKNKKPASEKMNSKQVVIEPPRPKQAKARGRKAFKQTAAVTPIDTAYDNGQHNMNGEYNKDGTHNGNGMPNGHSTSNGNGSSPASVSRKRSAPTDNIGEVANDATPTKRARAAGHEAREPIPAEGTNEEDEQQRQLQQQEEEASGAIKNAIKLRLGLAYGPGQTEARAIPVPERKSENPPAPQAQPFIPREILEETEVGGVKVYRRLFHCDDLDRMFPALTQEQEANLTPKDYEAADILMSLSQS
ncbi:hypothetical protein ABW19_dt0208424 [Dactylella cylindrospora]|nr:hypothetical protein ABW19_dt0208424 [Dactylella cylindrospora]